LEVAIAAYFPQITLTGSAGFHEFSAYQSVYRSSWVWNLEDHWTAHLRGEEFVPE